MLISVYIFVGEIFNLFWAFEVLKTDLSTCCIIRAYYVSGERSTDD